MPDGGSIESVPAGEAERDPALPSARYLKLSVIDSGRACAGDLAEGGRAVLLDQAGRQGHRPRPVDGPWAGGAARRRAGAVEPGRQGHQRHAVAAGRDRGAEAARRRSRKGQPPATILLVDDDPLIAMRTTEMLEDLGHKVIGANSGLHALDVSGASSRST